MFEKDGLRADIEVDDEYDLILEEEWDIEGRMIAWYLVSDKA